MLLFVSGFQVHPCWNMYHNFVPFIFIASVLHFSNSLWKPKASSVLVHLEGTRWLPIGLELNCLQIRSLKNGLTLWDPNAETKALWLVTLWQGSSLNQSTEVNIWVAYLGSSLVLIVVRETTQAIKTSDLRKPYIIKMKSGLGVTFPRIFGDGWVRRWNNVFSVIHNCQTSEQ